ncbi:WD-40 repeat-containing protein [Reticulomyxa filosa]|uniref:WD-40 repeat-containing protein n=1 Tax=Reticulomyxa filosa TaxID=46433 RepID=X6LYQ6_RETFI|nr:WD-40 repeat-containing protein [Reticulomyxa filosa]|eukprot:ETO05855.1 WD-40 repeat-containing protein [Reticulomyxa filosa]
MHFNLSFFGTEFKYCLTNILIVFYSLSNQKRSVLLKKGQKDNEKKFKRIFFSSCIVNKKLKSKKEEIQIIIQYWIRRLKIKLGWIKDFDKLIVNYVSPFVYTVFIFDTFRSSFKFLNTFTGHTTIVRSLDYLAFDGGQFICSGSSDRTVRVWDFNNNEQVQSFNGHSNSVYCVRFSQYHYHNNSQNVICSSSEDNTVRFWDFKHNKQLQIFNGHTKGVCGIEFSSFSGGRYLCSGSIDKTIRLWDVETSKSLHVFNGHNDGVWCVDVSPLQSNNHNNDKSKNIGVIGGSGYSICSGSDDKTIQIWDIETAKQLNVFKGHRHWITSVKYGSNELRNTILSGSMDRSIRLWDIRSSEQIQAFNEHKSYVCAVEYSPFVINDSGGNSNVICSGSYDKTILFWDIRSNKNELYMAKVDEEVRCLKFMEVKKQVNNDEQKLNCVNLCYGSTTEVDEILFLNGLVLFPFYMISFYKHTKTSSFTNAGCISLLNVALVSILVYNEKRLIEYIMLIVGKNALKLRLNKLDSNRQYLDDSHKFWNIFIVKMYCQYMLKNWVKIIKKQKRSNQN